MLKNCLENNNLKNNLEGSDRVKAYRLIVLSYIYSDETSKAIDYMEKMLKEDPEYILKPEDTQDFIHIYDLFKARPIISIGPIGGINVLQVSLLENFGIDNSNIRNQKYTNNTGFQGGISMEFPIRLIDKIDLSMVFNPQYSSYIFNLSDNLLPFTSLF